MDTHDKVLVGYGSQGEILFIEGFNSQTQSDEMQRALGRVKAYYENYLFIDLKQVRLVAR